MGFDIHRWIAGVQQLPYFRRRVEIARRITPSLSRFVYKYRAVDEADLKSVDRLRDILVRSRLWLSSPVDFNDPFDMAGKIVASASVKERQERINEILKKHRVPFKERERKRKSFMRKSVKALEMELESIYTKYTAKTGVYSFAGDARSILMWSHYAREHTGVCIQFERARDFGFFSGALSVEYSSEYPEVDWIRDFQGSLSKVLLRKHQGWCYEREFRIVRPNNAHTYLRFDPQAVVGVILGCRSTNEVRAVVDTLLEERSRAGIPPVRLLKARKHRSEYRLTVWAAE